MSRSITASTDYLEDETLPGAAKTLMSAILELPGKITARNLSRPLKELPNSLYRSLELLAQKGYLARVGDGSVASPFDIEYEVLPRRCPKTKPNAVHTGESL